MFSYILGKPTHALSSSQLPLAPYRNYRFGSALSVTHFTVFITDQYGRYQNPLIAESEKSTQSLRSQRSYIVTSRKNNTIKNAYRFSEVDHSLNSARNTAPVTIAAAI